MDSTRPHHAKISVVIAAYNERENAEDLTRRLNAVLRSLPGWDFEILFVVEGTDGTREVLDHLATEIPTLRILHGDEPTGLGRAFRRGFAAISPGSDYVITMDADLNHQPEEIPRLLESIRTRGLDILVGSRFVRGGRSEGTPAWKSPLSGTLNIVMRLAFGLKIRDKTSGFRIYRGEILPLISFQNNDFAFLPEILIRAAAGGLSIGEEAIHFIFRKQGVSKMRFWPTSRSYLRLFLSLRGVRVRRNGVNSRPNGR